MIYMCGLVRTDKFEIITEFFTLHNHSSVNGENVSAEKFN